MRRSIPFLVCGLAVLIFVAGCRVKREDTIGSYYLATPQGDGALAAKLDDDNSFYLYRGFHSDPHAPGTVVVVGDANAPVPDHSGGGTWKILNPTFLGPAEEAVQFDGDLYVDSMMLVQKDARVCLYTSGRDEYWCKKN